MKIDKLSISSFGKFEKKELIFNKGLNVIYGSNESGKTTVQMFIKAMLYYMEKKEERRYLPWNAEKFGAANTLTYILDNGQAYSVEKNFNRKTTSLYTMQPYEEVTALFPIHKGSVLFMEEQTGLNLTAFEASVFVKQMEMRMNRKDSKDVVERLVRLTRYGDENIDYNHAVKKLDELKDTIGTGNTGKHKKLIQANQLVSNLQDKLKKAEKNVKHVKEIQQKLDELNSEKQNISNEIEELTLLQYDKRRALMLHYEELNQKMQNNRRIHAELELQLTMYESISHITQSDIEALDEYLNKLQLVDQQLQAAKDKMVQYITEKEKIQEQLQSEAKNLGQTDIRIQLVGDKIDQLKSHMRISKIAAIVSALISGAGALVFGRIHLLWYSLIVLVPVVVLLFLSYSSGMSKRIQQLAGKQHQLEESIEINENLQVLKKLIEGLEYEQQKDTEKRESIVLLVNEMLERLNIRKGSEYTLTAVIYELKKTYNARLEIIRRLEASRKEIAAMNEGLEVTKKASADIYRDGLSGIEQQQYQLLAEKYGVDEQMTSIQMEQIIEEKKLELKEVELKISSMCKELEFLLKEYAHPGDIEEQLESALDEKKEYEETKEAIDIAKHYMEQSLKEVQQNYTPKLNQYTSDILTAVTAEKYHDVDTASDLSVLIRDMDNGLLDLNALSGGTVDQVYFALRLAIAKMLSANEMLPLIIDEPFAQYDDNRLKSALSFLVKIAENRQIVLFTCHRRELELLDLLDKEYNTILL